MQRIDSRLIASKIAEAAIRKALSLPYSLDGVPASLREAAEQALETIAAELTVTDEKGILRCGICGKGPFTRKGLYLHLRRIHIDAIEDYVGKVFEEYIWRKRSLARESPGAAGP